MYLICIVQRFEPQGRRFADFLSSSSLIFHSFFYFLFLSLSLFALGRQLRMEVPARVEDFIPRSVLDKIFLGYYVFQIVSTLGLDMQGTLPAFLYPAWVCT